MKNTYLFSPFLLVIGGYLWISASGGVADVQGQDRTGSPVSAQACNMCHQGNSFSVTTALVLIDANGDTVSEYQPNTSYTLTASINAPGASHYGFQITGLDAANNGIGTWTPNTTGTQKTTLNGRPYFEQKSPLADPVFECEWVSPDAGSGDVTFYGSALAVNGNGTATGDAYASFNDLVITEGSGLSVGITSSYEVKIFPNPAQQYLAISSTQEVESINIYALNGKKVLKFSSVGTHSVASLESGTYLVELVFANGKKQMEQLVKL